MADFTLVVTAGASIANWLDPPSVLGAPSRLNPKSGFPHKRWVGTLGYLVVIKANVGGVLGPDDSALGGRPFTAWLVEAPGGDRGDIVQPSGLSSWILVTPTARGHYVIGVRRPQGGLEHIHLDVQ